MRVSISKLKRRKPNMVRASLDLGGDILYVPIDILKDGTVLDGERRIRAALEKGWLSIHARVWDHKQAYRQFKDIELTALLNEVRDV